MLPQDGGMFLGRPGANRIDKTIVSMGPTIVLSMRAKRIFIIVLKTGI